jgi:predicted permease
MDPGAAMKAGGRGLTTGRERFLFQRLLVVAQISISLVLVVGALLFVRTFRNLTTLNPGFQQDGILVAFVDFRRLSLPPARVESFKNELLDRVRSIPQVASAATTSNIPLSGSSWTMGVRVPDASGVRKGASKITWVSPGYFRTMEIPMLAGRDFNANDNATSRKIAVVNETFVRTFLEGTNPIGRTFRTAQEPNYPEALYEIAGVVKDTKYGGLRQDTPPISFVPASQHPHPGPGLAMMIRSSAPMATVVMALKRTLTELNPEIAMESQIFKTQIREGLVRESSMAALSGFFGILAVLLAMIGLYGVISYRVVKRRNEIGIRVALGASQSHVLTLIMREAAVLLAFGVALGIVFSLVAGRAASALLFGLQPHDPLTLVGSAALLAVTAALACYWPAYGASRMDPMAALREE